MSSILLWILNSIYSLLWSAVVYRTHMLMRDLKRLSFAAPAADRESKSRVSAVLQVRNESSTIEETVNALLNQNGVDMQVIVVDDESTDKTCIKLEQIAQEDPRLNVLRQTKTPPSWSARCYAYEMGQAIATGDWILFTDGALKVGPRAVFNAVATMERERLDHLTLCPRIEAMKFLEAMLLPILVLLTHFRFVSAKALEQDSGVGVGVGAFNLVNASAYRLRGTHAQIRGSLIDEMALGRIMRADDGRGLILRAVGQVRRRYVGGLQELFNFSGSEVWVSCRQSTFLTFLVGTSLVCVPIVVALSIVNIISFSFEWPWIWLHFLVLVFWGIVAVLGLLRVRGLVRYPVWTIVFMPIGAMLFGFAVLRVTLIALIWKKISWHGHVYRSKDILNQKK